jgi:hypothetical protein
MRLEKVKREILKNVNEMNQNLFNKDYILEMTDTFSNWGVGSKYYEFIVKKPEVEPISHLKVFFKANKVPLQLKRFELIGYFSNLQFIRKFYLEPKIASKDAIFSIEWSTM